MNIHKEFKEIAKLNQKRDKLINKIEEKVDTCGYDYTRAYLISGCKEKDGHLYRNGKRLDNNGLVDDDYYCRQHTGMLGDDFYGTLFFKTDVPGQFVAVPFEAW